MFRNKCWLFLLLWPSLVWAGDPMRPPNLEAPAQEIVLEPLRLSMILREEGRHRAVVNGKVLDVSERIGTARLVAINDDHVVMARAGQSFVLRLSLPPVKQAGKGEIHE